MRRNAPAIDGSPDQFDAVTLGQFLAALPDAVRLVHDAGNGQVPLRWVEPSELEDPTPYLLDGEFVLTAGLPFRDGGDGAGPDWSGSAPRVQEYVRRLVEAGVAALGFGLQPYYDRVPEQVVAACRQYGLTLVEVPASVPFAALGLEFSKLLESGSAQVFRQLADTNRHLMRAVLSARPEHELLAALIQRVPVWAVLFGADGRVRARGGAAVDAARLQPLLKKVLSGSGPRVETETLDAPDPVLVFGHPLRSTKDATLGSLVLGAEKALTPAQNSVVSSVVGLLELLVRQRTSGSLAPSQLATALLLHPESLAAGNTRELNVLKDLLAQSVAGTRSTPVRVIQGMRAAGAAAGDDGPVRELLQWRRIFDSKMVELTDYGFAAVTRLKVDDQVITEVEQLGWRLVVGGPTELSGLPGSYRQVSALRPRVVATGKSARVEEVTWSVTGLLGSEAGTLFAGKLLAPVLGMEPDRRNVQLRVLRSWLAANGSWDATAKDLGLHRNSVRRQVNSIAELLELDLSQAQTRAELWIALQYADGVGAGDLQASQER